MLSRIAESMFWIGRYVERAEDTARLLQTHLRSLIEGSAGGETEACRTLLALMSVSEVADPSHEDLLQLLAWDARATTSIFFCWAQARDNARRAREVIPAELWESINITWQQLPPGKLPVTRANTFLDWARQRSSLFNGIARSTMVRDEGWQFLSMGRALEQADMTSRLVASAAVTVGGSRWVSVLRGAGGHDAFLRTYRGLHTDREAAQFLILDPRFPRSVMYALMSASDSLRKIVQHNSDVRRQAQAVERALGQVRARLEFADMDELLGNLDDEMGRVQSVASEVTAIISGAFFAAADARSWTTEGTR